MQEELDGKFVHLEAFGKRKGLAHEPPQALAQGVVEALDVVGGAFGIRGLVSRGGQDVAIAFQMIGARRALTVSGWDAGPKQLSRGVIARPQGMSDDLAGAPTEGQPRAENEDQDGGQRRAAGDGAPFPSEGLHRALLAPYRGFFKVWLSSGLFFAEMALWLLSLFGNFDLETHRWHLAGAAELFLFNALWAGLNVALIGLGARLAMRMLTGYGATFLIIQIYTLFFAHLAEALGLTLSLLIAGSGALALTFYLERWRREKT